MHAPSQAVALLCLLFAFCGPAESKPKRAAGKAAPAKAAKAVAPKELVAKPAAGKKKPVEKPAPPTAADKLPKSASLAAVEKDLLALPAPARSQAFNMMLALSSLVAPTLIEDAADKARAAANYSSGVAMERLQGLLAASDLPGAASCVGQFGAVAKNPAKVLALSFPDGCAGLAELHIAYAKTDPKVEGLAYQWATSAVQHGLAEAKKAGHEFRMRPTPLTVAAAYSEKK